MKMKNLFLVSLLTFTSLQIKSSDAQAQEFVAQEVVAEAQAQEEVAPVAEEETAPVAEVNPIPEEVQPYSSAVIRWAFAGQTPEERSQRAALLLKWDYATDGQTALLSTLIIAPAQEAEETN